MAGRYWGVRFRSGRRGCWGILRRMVIRRERYIRLRGLRRCFQGGSILWRRCRSMRVMIGVRLLVSWEIRSSRFMVIVSPHREAPFFAPPV